MKNLLVVLSLFVLSACGNKDKAKLDPIALDQSPQISIPANATVTDYSCEEVATYNVAGATGLNERTTYGGVNYIWIDADTLVTYNQNNSGQIKELSREKSQDNGTQRRSTIDVSTWNQINSIWSKKTQTIDQTSVLENGQRRIVLYRVNGVPTSPTWSSTVENIASSPSWKKIDHHLNPASRNDGTRTYSNIDQTCVYTQRWR
jgi:hypothetical protein